MKFYIISIILNILLLFIPITLPKIKKNENKNMNTIKISVNTEKIGKSKENPKEINEKIENEISPKIEKKVEKKYEIIKNNIQKNENKIDPAINNSNKKSNENNKIIQENNSGIGNKVEIGSYSTTSNSNVGESSDVNGKNKFEKNKVENSGKEGNVCREGIDFVVNYTPLLPYPIMAQRLGITGDVVVNVKFSFKNDGKIVILHADGGHKIFQDEAKRATNKIKITIKNKESLKCIIIKPFRFKKL